jgi:hypothetical protein
VEERYSHNFLASFAAAEKYIAMTYAAPGQSGWHHVNCQPQPYWIDKIERLGFRFDEKLSEQARRVAEPDSHFARCGSVFVRIRQKPGSV